MSYCCYVIALYYRLSVLNKDKNNSIENQKTLLKNYLQTFLKKESITEYVIEEYEDNGYSGMDFNRPGVKKLLRKIQTKKVNCVIVKDFSRFGRDNVMMDKFLNEVFPYNNIRFVSILDRYDNKAAGGETSLEVDFKLLMNSFYARDLSQKMLSTYKTKMENGSYRPSLGFYGYLKDAKTGDYTIDEEPYRVIRYIVQMVLLHVPVKVIAQILNEKNIPTPSQYKQIKMGHSSMFEVDVFWNPTMIYRILNDKSYTGVKYVGKTRAEKRKRKSVPPSGWYLAVTMEPTITEEEFEEIHNILSCNRGVANSTSIPMEENFLKGKISCGGCRHKMQGCSHKGILNYYYCSFSGCNVPDTCYNGHFPKQKLYDIIYGAIQKKIQLIDTKCSLIKKETQIKFDYEAQIREHNLRKRKIQTEKFILFEKLNNGDIMEVDYKKGVDALDEELSNREVMLSNARIALEDREEHLHQISKMVKLVSYERQDFNREMVESFIKNIIIYSDDRVEIEWNFKDLVN